MKLLKLSIIMLLIFQSESIAQNIVDFEKNIIGNWECVKFNSRGNQKFSISQANQIKKSILVIQKNSFYYNRVKFVDICKFSNWKISLYDTVNLTGNFLDFIYSKKDLINIKVLDPVDNVNEYSCFNNCAEFFLKDDTLINICGGYAYYLKKINYIDFKLKGSGSFIKEFSLVGNESFVYLDYEFFKDPDQLLIFDESGNQLFKSAMTTTSSIKKEKIKLNNIKKVYLKIKPSTSNSMWSVKIVCK
jgi:dipeptidyl aminopeptidase/acylaminoacyl peptidase